MCLFGLLGFFSLLKVNLTILDGNIRKLHRLVLFPTCIVSTAMLMLHYSHSNTMIYFFILEPFPVEAKRYTHSYFPLMSTSTKASFFSGYHCFIDKHGLNFSDKLNVGRIAWPHFPQLNI